jgi:hypothetical protein
MEAAVSIESLIVKVRIFERVVAFFVFVKAYSYLSIRSISGQYKLTMILMCYLH